MYHRVFRYALGGATAYVVCDALDELFIYLHCRRIGMRAARGSDELRAEIGIDMRAGPWYNSSLRTSHYGHMASCSFPVEGDRLGTEVAVRLVRARGVPSSFVHNVIGTGKWRIMSATATLPGAGGLPRTLNLAGSGAGADAGADGAGSGAGADERGGGGAGQTVFTFQDLIDWR